MIASLFSTKADKWISGRKDWQHQLAKNVSQESPWVWVHAASLGEFEQGRPLIERLKRDMPGVSVLLTFFSPSGYEVRKDYSFADHVCYIPLDTRRNARKFVDILNPALAIFIKYEIWYHHLSALSNAGIPTILISAQFRPSQFYFKPFGKFFLPVMRSLKQIFVVDAGSLGILSSNNFSNTRISGDTRIDRVIETSRSHRDFTFIRNVLQSDEILVCGSTWPKDEAIVVPTINKRGLKAVIAPHEISEANLISIEEALTGTSCRLSRLTSDTRTDVVIVDSIGDLADIYHIATEAYIGGGFGSGIHNILEASVFGIPVIFGPNHLQFAEAVDLIHLKAAFPVSGIADLEGILDEISHQQFRAEIADVLRAYFRKHEGATTLIYDYICAESLL